MTTLRKAMPLIILCAALAGLPLAAQDCSFTFAFTGNATQTAVSNISGNVPCVNWRITLSATGSLSTTATFYTSPDNSVFTAVPNTVCSSTVQPPCILQGANPIVGTQGMMYVAAYGAFVRIVTTSSSGTGSGTIRGYGAKGASAQALPSSGGGSGTVSNVATTSPITGGPITGTGTIGLDTTKVAQKFFGTAAPGSVATNLPGDLFTDTTAHNEYVCNAPSGTAAPACTSVTAAGWLLVNGGGGGSGTVTNTGTLPSNALILGNGGVDVKPGAVLPADSSKFFNGAGGFTVPPTASAVPAASNLTPVTVSANTTGDQILQEVSLATGILNTVAAANLIHGSGILTIAALQTPTLTFKAKLCTVSGCGSGTVRTLATITTGATIAATNNGWNLQLMAGTVSSGSAGTLAVHGAPGLTVDIGALPGSAATLYVDTNTTVTSAIDLTAALFVDFTVSTSAGNTGNSFTQNIAESLPWAGAGSSFLHSRSLTIDHTKCGSSNSTNFPVLVSLSNTTFKTVANGGHVQNASGYDIVFAADSAGVTQYPWEVEFYDGVNGVLVAWVQVPTVSHTVDTVFYVIYDNGAISTAQNTGALAPTNVWDSNYVGVWHLPNGTTLTANDSTSNAINGTLTNAPTATAGEIDGAGAFVHASNQNINLGSGSALQVTGVLTIEAWFNASTDISGCRLFSNRSGSAGYEVYYDNGPSIHFGINGNDFSTGISLSTPYHLAATYNGTTTGTIYLNAVPGSPYTGFPSLNAGSTAMIGAAPFSASFTWPGWIDEVRLSKIVRGADWILTEYNNQFGPGNIGSANFITYGSEI
jgi:hypothetical protein